MKRVAAEVLGWDQPRQEAEIAATVAVLDARYRVELSPLVTRRSHAS